MTSNPLNNQSPDPAGSRRAALQRVRREATIVDPVSGENIVIDLDRFPACSPTQPYRGYQVATGPYRHYYLAAIFRDGRAEMIEGPCANGATALSEAKRRIDTVLADIDTHRGGVRGNSAEVALRALQKLDAVARAPDAAMGCESQEDRLMICASTKALCDEIGIHIRWLSRAGGEDNRHA